MKELPRSREAAKVWDENAIAREVVDAALSLHRELGPGLLESVYEVLLADELKRHGLCVERQVVVPITYRGRTFVEGFRADLIVEGKVCIELKSVEAFSKCDPKPLRTYLILPKMKLGILISCNAPLSKNASSRIVTGHGDYPYSKNLRGFAPSRED